MLAEQLLDGVVIDSWTTVGQPNREVYLEETEASVMGEPAIEYVSGPIATTFDSSIVEATQFDTKTIVPQWEEKIVEDSKVADVTDDNKINEKFQSFREKFLDRESQADSFENEIIEKMDRRVAKLKEFAQVLDGENDYLEEFKKEKLGQ